MVTIAVLYAAVALNVALVMVRDDCSNDRALGYLCLAAVWPFALLGALTAIVIDEAIARYRRR